MNTYRTTLDFPDDLVSLLEALKGHAGVEVDLYTERFVLTIEAEDDYEVANVIRDLADEVRILTMSPVDIPRPVEVEDRV